VSGDSLRELGERLRTEATPISPHILAEPSGPAYDSFVLDAVREGYLLHYGEPRLLAGQDADLGLLAGDYLYALGIERLAALGDTGAVLELADLISACAQLQAEGRGGEETALWRAAAVAIGGHPAGGSQ
jgi:hypothetical protein